MSMNQPSPTELKQQRLERQYAFLTEKHTAVERQLRTTLNEADKPALSATIAALEQELQATWNELYPPDQPALADDIQQQQRQWQDALLTINFREAWRDFERVYSQYVDLEEGGAALILAPDFENMCGQLLLRRIDGWLQEHVGYEKIRRAPIEIMEHNDLTPAQFMERLGSHFKYSFADGETGAPEQARHVHKLTDKMCSVLGMGQLLLIELTVYSDDFYAQADFLAWLLDEFWAGLVASVQRVARDVSFVKCILFISVDQALPPAPLDGRYCPLSEYQPLHRQLACLPLSPWSETEIKAWLLNHSGLAQHWDKHTLDAHAHAIFQKSHQGKPILAQIKLNELRSQHWTQ